MSTGRDVAFVDPGGQISAQRLFLQVSGHVSGALKLHLHLRTDAVNVASTSNLTVPGSHRPGLKV